MELRLAKFSSEEIEKLKSIAQNKYGTPNLSLLGREVFKSLIEEDENKSENKSEKPIKEEQIYYSPADIKKSLKGDRERLVIRLTKMEKEYFEQAAQSNKMTANMYVRQLLRYHIDKQPTLTKSELEAVFKSNWNMVRIGRFLNVIVKHLKTAGAISISTAQIERFGEEIKKHTDTIGKLVAKSKERF